MTETLPLSEVKARLSEVVDRIETTHARVVVTRNGRPAAVLMSPEDLSALEETLDVLSDPAAMKRLAKARADVAAGRVVTGEELASRYRKR
jgi:prevent-host-death family protein